MRETMTVGFEDCTRCIIILLYKVYHYLGIVLWGVCLDFSKRETWMVWSLADEGILMARKWPWSFSGLVWRVSIIKRCLFLRTAIEQMLRERGVCERGVLKKSHYRPWSGHGPVNCCSVLIGKVQCIIVAATGRGSQEIWWVLEKSCWHTTVDRQWINNSPR